MNKQINENQLRLIISESIKQAISFNEEKIIIESVVLSENIVGKFKELLQKGLITTTIISSLLASPNISAEEKAEIKDIYKTEKQQLNINKSISINVKSQNTSIQEKSSKYNALKNLRLDAKRQIFKKYNLDPNKFDVKITNLNINSEKTVPDQNKGNYNTTIEANVTMEIVKKVV